MSFSVPEVEFLATHQAEITAVASDIDLSAAAQVATAATMRTHFGDYSRAVLELLAARAKAANKLPMHWLMCTDSSQQATDPLIVAHRAKRITTAAGDSTTVADVTCSIGTEVAGLRARNLSVVGFDLDPARLAMARHNIGANIFAQADALNPPHTPDHVGVIIADPARRAGGRRITNPTDLIPPLPELIATYPGRELAIKCAPGLDFSDWEGLVSVASVDGGVKEACLYTPGLNPEGNQREALVLRHDGFSDIITGAGNSAETHPTQAETYDPGRYIIDPDGAIVRAGLVTDFAEREGLWQLDTRIAYLTGDRIPTGYSGFEIIESTTVKKVAQRLKSYDAGAVEILIRGIDANPDQLRKQWKLKGKASLAVVLTRIGRQGVAFICKARERATTMADS